MVGIVLLAASILVMPILARAKRRVGERLGGDPLILADAAETKICVLLSVSTLAALILYSLTGAAWLDPVAGFVIAVFAINEGREAWHGELIENKTDETDETGGSVDGDRVESGPGRRPVSKSGEVPRSATTTTPPTGDTAAGADPGVHDRRGGWSVLSPPRSH